ncbi:hypothetical protein RBS60_10995 [Sinomonas sp. ASV486]|uniref:hypothetical protein n=1 Tax=Sinomonas sp. ASV486 TaxID=3051170 RepID=UPI0027DD1129|nr:hypothetical protein [Sinomonas sp. ASV486]MDQ4490724.1 hypothetical protein [Sinomonas sp. ASV486]
MTAIAEPELLEPTEAPGAELRPYYRLTVTDEQVLAYARLADAAERAREALARLKNRRDEVDRQLADLAAEVQTRAAQRAAAEADADAAADRGDVDAVAAATSYLGALDRVEKARALRTEAVRADAAKVAEQIATAAQEAQEAADALAAAPIGVPRSDVDAVARGQIVALVEAWPGDDLVHFVETVLPRIPDLVAAYAQEDPEGFMACVPRGGPDTPEPAPHEITPEEAAQVLAEHRREQNAASWNAAAQARDAAQGLAVSVPTPAQETAATEWAWMTGGTQ